MHSFSKRAQTITLKMADQRRSDIYVVFTEILFGRNFCVWEVRKLKFTGQLQMASLSLSPQFEANLISNGTLNQSLQGRVIIVTVILLDGWLGEEERRLWQNEQPASF